VRSLPKLIVPRTFTKTFSAQHLCGQPTILQLANSWIILNVGGGPTDDSQRSLCSHQPTLTKSVASCISVLRIYARVTKSGEVRVGVSSPSRRTTEPRFAATCATQMGTWSRSGRVELRPIVEALTRPSINLDAGHKQYAMRLSRWPSTGVGAAACRLARRAQPSGPAQIRKDSCHLAQSASMSSQPLLSPARCAQAHGTTAEQILELSFEQQVLIRS
jgi:hypothetical protein